MRFSFKAVLVKHFFLLTALLLLALAVFLDKGYLLMSNNKAFMGFEIEEVQRVYSQKESLVLGSLAEAEATIDSAKTDLRTSLFKRIDNVHLSENGVFLLVYQNDKLLYWSDNSVPTPKSLKKSNLNVQSANLENGFYSIYQRQFKGFVAVGLILLRHQFDHQNEFLRDRFQKDFPLPTSIQISQLDIMDENRLFNYKKEYLLTLVPSFLSRADKPFYVASITLYFLSYLFFIIYLNTLVNDLYRYRPTLWWLVPFAFVWVAVRWWMIEFKDPAALYSLKLFDPHFFSQSFWAPSLGDLLINNILFFYLAYKFHKFAKPERLIEYIKQKNTRSVSRFLLQFLVAVFTLGIFWVTALKLTDILKGLVLNSNISFEVYEILEINQYTVLGYLIAGIGLAALLTFMDKFAHILNTLLHGWVNLLLLLSSTAAVVVLYGYYSNVSAFSQIVLLASLLAVLVFTQLWYERYPYYVYTLIIFMTSVFTVTVVTQAMAEKDRNTRRAMVEDLAEEHDHIAEALLTELEKNVLKDGYVQDFIYGHAAYDDTKVLYKHLQKKYFGGYLSKYDFKISICDPNDVVLLNLESEGQTCYDFYTEMIKEMGKQLRSSNIYFKDNENGRISYLGWLRFTPPRDSLTDITLFLELESKQLLSDQTGYPELLLDEKLKGDNAYIDYNYAKYKNGRLVSQVGEYPYKLQRSAYAFSTDTFSFVNINEYNHLLYNKSENSAIVLSRKNMTALDYAVFFAYIFASYYLILLLTIMIIRIRSHLVQPKLYFKSRIQFSMIAMLSMSMFLIGGGTIYFNVMQYQSKHYDNIREKVQSVVNQLEGHLGYEHELNSNWHTNRFVNLNELLYQTSHVFFSDVNLYDMNGHLLATSRPEIFEKGFQSKKIHPEVYKELIIKERINYIHNEKIGDLEFFSAYIPFYNYENQILAYLNIPYFARQSELKRELSTLVVALINIYLVLILFAIFLTILISNKITEPLKLVQESFRDMELGKRDSIQYNGDDEIGNLVKEYNNKVKELAESAEKLAATEREVAWREMAKQVAHEIKNPLTPMQLSLQLMLRSWRDEDPRFGKRLEKTAGTLIEQIERLTRIATEFSNFAKMPEPKNKVFNIVNEVEKITQLFQSEDAEFDINLNNYEKLYVYADDEQFARALTNLVKNAIQAIPKEREGMIKVELFSNQKIVRIMVEDNGTGIPEDVRPKLFQPNFTTKSSGTGVGLYIVQSIIKSAKGRIWFETEIDKGTQFYIEIPLTDKPPGGDPEGILA